MDTLISRNLAGTGLSAFRLVNLNLNANRPESLEPQNFRVGPIMRNTAVVQGKGSTKLKRFGHCNRSVDAYGADEDVSPWNTPLTVSCSLVGPRPTFIKHQKTRSLRRPPALVWPLPAASNRWSRHCRSRFEQLRWARCRPSRWVTEALCA